MKRQTVENQVKLAQRRRLINSEYRRGFMEGQHEAAMMMAECIDKILANHNSVSCPGGFATTVVSTETGLEERTKS